MASKHQPRDRSARDQAAKQAGSKSLHTDRVRGAARRKHSPAPNSRHARDESGSGAILVLYRLRLRALAEKVAAISDVLRLGYVHRISLDPAVAERVKFELDTAVAAVDAINDQVLSGRGIRSTAVLP